MAITLGGGTITPAPVKQTLSTSYPTKLSYFNDKSIRGCECLKHD